MTITYILTTLQEYLLRQMTHDFNLPFGEGKETSEQESGKGKTTQNPSHRSKLKAGSADLIEKITHYGRSRNTPRLEFSKFNKTQQDPSCET